MLFIVAVCARCFLIYAWFTLLCHIARTISINIRSTLSLFQINKSERKEIQRFLSIFKKSEHSSTLCPDGCSHCPDGYTCCLDVYGRYNCCPLKNAVCCPDHINCCPYNYVCRPPYCYPKSEYENAPLLKTTNIQKKLFYVMPFYDTENVLCPDREHVCPDGTSCCISGYGSFSCCPYKSATCCSDGLHCCPKGFTCDSKSGHCLRKANIIPVKKKVESVSSFLLASAYKQHVVDISQQIGKRIVNCSSGGTFFCEDGETCCEITESVYGCCPLPDAVCCKDGKHCCPSGTTCDLKQSKCKDGSGKLLNILQKKLAKIHERTSHRYNQNFIKCPDKKHYCPSTASCCMVESGEYGCCPISDAVCCSDKEHCCPNGYQCQSGNATVN